MEKQGGTTSSLFCSICENILTSGFGIVLLDDLRPNVMLELGLLYGCGKPVIVFKSKKIDLPSDISNIKYYDISSPIELVDNLSKIEKDLIIPDTFEEGYIEFSKTILSKISEEINDERKELKGFHEPDFYNDMRQIIEKSKSLRFGAKTPVLLLPTEIEKQERNRYYETLMMEIKNGEKHLRYLFGLKTTENVIKGYNSHQKMKFAEHLEKLLILLPKVNFDIRYVESEDFMSGVIGDDEAMWIWHDLKTGKTLGVIRETGEKLYLFKDYFDCNFINAKRLEKEIIERWLKESRE